MKKKSTKPTVYKFTFYGCTHPWIVDSKDKVDVAEQVEEALCYVDGLLQMTKLEATKMNLTETTKRKHSKK